CDAGAGPGARRVRGRRDVRLQVGREGEVTARRGDGAGAGQPAGRGGVDLGHRHRGVAALGLLPVRRVDVGRVRVGRIVGRGRVALVAVRDDVTLEVADA